MKINPLEKIALSLFILALIITLLILAKVVLIPMAISVFLTYMLYPLVWKIERKGVNRAVSILIVLLLTFLLFGGAVLFVSF